MTVLPPGHGRHGHQLGQQRQLAARIIACTLASVRLLCGVADDTGCVVVRRHGTYGAKRKTCETFGATLFVLVAGLPAESLLECW